MDRFCRVLDAMIAYYAGEPRWINHFLKVHGFAAAIAGREGLDAGPREILEIAALTHDIGIKASLQKGGSGKGHEQEIEGPPVARAMLLGLGCPPPLTERVCWLIAHHHTYGDIRDMDHQILVEADFLVNIFEGEMDREAIRTVRRNVFRTEAGLLYLQRLYGAGDDEA